MRGSPPLHIFLFALAFALFAVPLARLTFARPAPPAKAVVVEKRTTGTPTLLRVRLAHQPATLSVTLDGKSLLQAADNQSTLQESRVDISIPAEGVELLIEATWPAGTPDTPITVELEPDGLDTQSQTRWSSGGTLHEPFSYHWNP